CFSKASTACSTVPAQYTFRGKPSRICRRALLVSSRLETINSSTRIIGRLFLGLVPARDMIETYAYRRGVSKRRPGDLCMDQEKSVYPEDSEVLYSRQFSSCSQATSPDHLSLAVNGGGVLYMLLQLPPRVEALLTCNYESR